MGSISALVFDGQSWTPYLISSTSAGLPGTIYSIFTESNGSFSSSSNLSLGAIVGIGLAISLFIVLALVAIGVLFAYAKRRSQGYRHPPTEKNLTKLPPTALLGNLDAGDNSYRYL